MSLRTRLTLTYTVAAAILVAIIGIVVVTALRTGLTSNLDAALASRGADVASQASSERSSPSALEASNGIVVQLLDGRGRVLDGSDAVGDRPLADAAGLRSANTRDVVADLTLRTAGGEHTYRTLTIRTASNTFAVLAADRAVVDTPVVRTAGLLAVVSVVLVGAAGTGSWLQARTALRAVDHMREQARALTVSEAKEGIAVPRTHDELSRLAVTFNDLLRRLHTAFEQERSFGADAGHELRTPLTVLRGELDLGLQPDRTVDELRSTVDIASRQTDRLVRLAEGLLDLVNVERPHFDRFDLVALLWDCIEQCRHEAAAAGVRVELHAVAALPATGDETALHRAVLNVLANAIRYAPRGSSVHVTAESSSGWWRVVVRDRGPGFPAQFIDHAFERFSQADPARRRLSGTGSGLGLAIVAATLTAHGGVAQAENRVDGGARVSISWPRSAVTRW